MPDTVTVDADRFDRIAAPIDRGQDVSGGDPRDLVFGRLAAEEHDNPQRLISECCCPVGAAHMGNRTSHATPEVCDGPSMR